MSATTATAQFGTLLKVGDGSSPEVFTAVAEVTSIAVPAFDRNMTEATHHESPSTTQEFVPTLRLAPTFSCTLNWLPDDATQNETAGLLYYHTQGTKKNYQIVFSNATFTVAAYVKTFQVQEVGTDGIKKAQVTFQTSGPITVS